MAEAAWPNVEKGLTAWLESRLAVPVYTELPAEISPAVGISRVGGALDWLSREIDVEAEIRQGSRGDLWALAGAVESAMYALGGSGVPGLLYVDEVREAFAFAVITGSSSPRRATATFTLTVRPQA